ncbi:DUF4398 domain-containing protein [Telmatospirillum sp. J64-1]|uniref:DUF4398 domain-containing protein n=1 Tax=Telmatospirillum sp. J64-1 TaxID=2502183 RepID=UPI00115E032E|nr:DUF4398 domain-containing protein [Telmatospirillum sp. J64-1]
MKFLKPRHFVLVAAAATLAACGTYEPPQGPLASANQAILSAANVGADDLAPLEMRIARERLLAAQSADNDESVQRYAAEAMASAELAQSRAEAQRYNTALDTLGRTSQYFEGQTARSPMVQGQGQGQLQGQGQIQSQPQGQLQNQPQGQFQGQAQPQFQGQTPGLTAPAQPAPTQPIR